MEKEYPVAIEREQGKIKKLENEALKQGKTPELKKKLEEHHRVFFDTVDQAKNDLFEAKKSLKGSDPDVLNAVVPELHTYETNLKTYLADAAHFGQEAFRKESAEMGKSEFSSDLGMIEARAGSTAEKSTALKNAVPLFKAFELSSVNKKTAEKNKEAIEEIKNNDFLTPEEKREELENTVWKTIEELGKAKSTITSVRDYPPELQELVEEMVAPIQQDIDETSKILVYYAHQDFCDSEEYKKYVQFDPETGGFSTTPAYESLPSATKVKILVALSQIESNIKESIEEKNAGHEHEKKYYEGEKALKAGDYTGAKIALISFYHSEKNQEKHTPENEVKLQKAAEILKNIAKMEIGMAEGRLNAMELSIKNYTGALDLGTATNEAALVNVEHMRVVLEKAKSLVEGKTCLTLEDAYKQLHEEKDIFLNSPLDRFQRGFDGANSVFDVLKTQMEISKITDPIERKRRFLALGKEAQRLGLYTLDQRYREAAFEDEINAETGKISQEEFAKKMHEDKNFTAEVNSRIKGWKDDAKNKFADEYREKFGPEPGEYAWSVYDQNYATESAAAEKNIYDSMVNEAYSKLIKTNIHKRFQSNPGLPGASDWNEAYGNTFVNVENIDTRWYQFWKFTDAEWNVKRVQYALDVAMLIIAAATAGAGSVAMVGTRAALVEGLGQAALSEAGQLALKRGGVHLARFAIETLGAREAAKYGIRSVAEFGVKSALFTSVDGALKGAIESNWSTYGSPKAFMKAWGNNVVMLAASEVGELAWGAISPFKIPKNPRGRSTLIQRGADFIGNNVVQTVMMQGGGVGVMLATGEVVTEEKFAEMLKGNVIMAVGLQGAHLLSAPLNGDHGHETSSHDGEAEHSPTMKKLSKKADRAEFVERVEKAKERYKREYAAEAKAAQVDVPAIDRISEVGAQSPLPPVDGFEGGNSYFGDHANAGDRVTLPDGPGSGRQTLPDGPESARITFPEIPAEAAAKGFVLGAIKVGADLEIIPLMSRAEFRRLSPKTQQEILAASRISSDGASPIDLSGNGKFELLPPEAQIGAACSIAQTEGIDGLKKMFPNFPLNMEFVSKLIQEGLVFRLLSSIKEFAGLDTNWLAVELISLGHIYDLMDHWEHLQGLDQKGIVQLLINRGEVAHIMTNSHKFPQTPEFQRFLADAAIKAGLWIVAEKASFKLAPDIDLALKLIEHDLYHSTLLYIDSYAVGDRKTIFEAIYEKIGKRPAIVLDNFDVLFPLREWSADELGIIARELYRHGRDSDVVKNKDAFADANWEKVIVDVLRFGRELSFLEKHILKYFPTEMGHDAAAELLSIHGEKGAAFIEKNIKLFQATEGRMIYKSVGKRLNPGVVHENTDRFFFDKDDVLDLLGKGYMHPNIGKWFGKKRFSNENKNPKQIAEELTASGRIDLVLCCRKVFEEAGYKMPDVNKAAEKMNTDVLAANIHAFKNGPPLNESIAGKLMDGNHAEAVAKGNFVPLGQKFAENRIAQKQFHALGIVLGKCTGLTLDQGQQLMNNGEKVAVLNNLEAFVPEAHESLQRLSTQGNPYR